MRLPEWFQRQLADDPRFDGFSIRPLAPPPFDPSKPIPPPPPRPKR